MLRNAEHRQLFLDKCLDKGKVDKIKMLLELPTELFNKEKYEEKLVSSLLLYGATGNQGAAEVLIKANPQLLLKCDTVKDFSGRIFKDVTFFKLICYCLDARYMGGMVLDCLAQHEDGEKIRQELVLQLNEFKKCGVSYQLKIGDYLPKNKEGEKLREQLVLGFMTLKELGYINYPLNDEPINEFFFSLEPLIDALQYYVDHNDAWDKTNKERTIFWSTVVGLLQTLLTSCLRQHYCDPEESFKPIPAFNKEKFKRSLEFNAGLRPPKMELWDDSCFRLGIFGMIRSSGDYAGWFSGGEGQSGCTGESICVDIVASDLLALKALYKVKVADFSLLEQRLNKPIQYLEQKNHLGL